MADAGARLRVVLRNQVDQKLHPLGTVSLLSLGPAPKPVVTSSFAPAVPQSKPVELEMRLLEVSADQLSSYAPGAGSDV